MSRLTIAFVSVQLLGLLAACSASPAETDDTSNASVIKCLPDDYCPPVTPIPHPKVCLCTGWTECATTATSVCTACGGNNERACPGGASSQESGCNAPAIPDIATNTCVVLSNGVCPGWSQLSSSGTECVACGGANEPACTGATTTESGCTTGTVLSGGYCKICGGDLEPACAGGICNPGTSNMNGTCSVPCGQNGQTTCPGGACSSGTINTDGTCCAVGTSSFEGYCETCGDAGDFGCGAHCQQGTCVGGTCNPGLVPAGNGADGYAGGACMPCGGNNQPQCGDGTCTPPNIFIEGSCSCGGIVIPSLGASIVEEPACTGGVCYDGINVGGICSCGHLNEPSCVNSALGFACYSPYILNASTNTCVGCSTAVPGAIAGPTGTCAPNVLSVANTAGATLVTTDVPTLYSYAYALYDGAPYNLSGVAASTKLGAGLAPNGQGNQVSFTPGAFPPNQTVVIYDTPYGTGPNDEGGSGDQSDVLSGTWGCPSTHYVQLSGGAGGQTVTATDVNVQHVVRYVEGTCRIKIPLNQLFDLAVGEINTEIAQLPSIVNHDQFIVMQPQYRSRGSSFQSGFLAEALANATILGIGGNISLDPVFSLTGGTASPTPDGLVGANLLAQNVTLIFPASFNTTYQTKLVSSLEAQANALIESKISIPLTTLISAIPASAAACTTPTPGAASPECFNNIQPLVALASGVNSLATMAAPALQVQNFTCSSTNQCEFHPIVQQVNVLPTSVEMVVAPDLTNATQDFLTPLYTTLLADYPQDVTQTISVGGSNVTVAIDCSTLPTGVTSGNVTTVLSGDSSLAAGMQCGAIATGN